MHQHSAWQRGEAHGHLGTPPRPQSITTNSPRQSHLLNPAGPPQDKILESILCTQANGARGCRLCHMRSLQPPACGLLLLLPQACRWPRRTSCVACLRHRANKAGAMPGSLILVPVPVPSRGLCVTSSHIQGSSSPGLLAASVKDPEFDPSLPVSLGHPRPDQKQLPCPPEVSPPSTSLCSPGQSQPVPERASMDGKSQQLETPRESVAQLYQRFS